MLHNAGQMLSMSRDLPETYPRQRTVLNRIICMSRYKTSRGAPLLHANHVMSSQILIINQGISKATFKLRRYPPADIIISHI